MAAVDPQPTTNLNYAIIPAKEGQSRCPRCGGAVFQAEAVPVRGKVSKFFYIYILIYLFLEPIVTIFIYISI